jgi:hypothetical protein
MPDDGSADDLPILDVRSPAERTADAGRDAITRVQGRLRESHLDIAAVAWMICVLGVTAVAIYSAFRQSFGLGPDSGWEKAAVIASSGGILLTFGAMIAVALAFSYDTRPARVALSLAIVAGLWSVIANVVGVAVSFHESSEGGVGFISLSRGAENQFVTALGCVLAGGLGLVVFLVAGNALTARSATAATGREIAELD